jgi:predicted nucleic acid-binding protein
MKVLVDTSVWSLALRRSATAVLNTEQQHAVALLSDLIRDGRAVMIGPIRQELLTGVRTEAGFDTLKLALAAFEDLPLGRPDYEKAAEVFNTCRAHGVQGSNTDFLICAVSINHRLPIFSVDKDFLNFEKYVVLMRHG